MEEESSSTVTNPKKEVATNAYQELAGPDQPKNIQKPGFFVSFVSLEVFDLENGLPTAIKNWQARFWPNANSFFGFVTVQP